jgi:hypothetical protein
MNNTSPICNTNVEYITMKENEVNHECERKGYIHLDEDFKFCPHCGEELYFYEENEDV